MDAAFPARFPFEMLHRVCDINRVAIDPRFFEGAIQDLAGRSDKGFAAQVLLVARLFAEEHDRGAFLAFAENGLGGVFVERTSGAAGRGFAQFR